MVHKKILLYSTYDSFINSGIVLCKDTFNKYPDTIYIHKTKVNQVSARQVKNIPFKYKNIRFFLSSNEIQEYDVVILSFGIKHHLLFNSQLNIYGFTVLPLLISCMPGTGFNRPENFLCRLYSDILLLNCKSDYDEFINTSEKYGYNKLIGFFYGLPQINTTLIDKNDCTKPTESIAFFDQLIVPTTVNEKRKIIDYLILYATTYPNKKVYIKPRIALRERTFHNQKLSVLNILNKHYNKDLPGNLFVTNMDVPDLVSITDLCLTVSSTVAIEYLAYGKNSALISDFGISEKLLNHHFIGSNLFISLDQLFSDNIPKVNPKWFDYHCKTPKHRVICLQNLIRSKLSLSKLSSFNGKTYLNYPFYSRVVDILYFYFYYCIHWIRSK